MIILSHYTIAKRGTIMAVYTIADPHLGHQNILKIRPQFASIEEHDAYIVDRILSVCGKRDSLHILGDVCLGKGSIESLKKIAEGVEHLHICLGNHDGERKGSPTIKEMMEICKGVYGMRKYKWAWLTHCPMHPQELWGKINIHGHLHDGVVDDPRYFCVSAEQMDYTPINMEVIFERCRKAGLIGKGKPATSRIEV